MRQYGTLKIYLDCIRVMGPSRSVMGMCVCTNTIRGIDRGEAQAIINEHNKQARKHQSGNTYRYEWQPESEAMDPDYIGD